MLYGDQLHHAHAYVILADALLLQVCTVISAQHGLHKMRCNLQSPDRCKAPDNS